jgi:hypothetical protein
MLLDQSSAAHASHALSALPAGAALAVGAGFFFLLALVIGASLWLRQKLEALTLERNSGDRSKAEMVRDLETHAQLIRQMSTDIEELRKRLSERNEQMGPSLPLWSSADVPVNLNRRGQIIRLSRKGKSIPEIAQDLNVAQGEVELLLKVHDLSQQKLEQGQS